MFLKHSKKIEQEIKEERDKEVTIYPILSAIKLLSGSSHRKILQTIATVIATDDFRFEFLYMPLINNFAEYVQGLHDVGKNSLSQLINIGLERAVFVCQEYLKQHGDDNDYVYLYALFSAALLLDLGRVDYNRKVILSTSTGVFIKEWQPFLGESLFSEGNYYKVRQAYNSTEALTYVATPILAMHVMPELGIICIREHPSLFAAWLATLARDDRGDDSFSTDLKMYGKKFWQDKKNQFLHHLDIESILDDSLLSGEEFWCWLKKKLTDKNINKTKSPVQKTALGIQLDIEVLAKEFCNIYSDKFPNWTSVVQQFNSLGIAKLSGGDLKYEQFFGEKINHAHKVTNSMFIKDNATTNKKLSIVTIENARGFLPGNNTTEAAKGKSKSSLAEKHLIERAAVVFAVANLEDQKLDPNQTQT